MTFSPIAIVGRSCLLPNAQTPQELWDAVVAGRTLISDCPSQRWRVPVHEICSTGDEYQDRSFSQRGGYVRDFERIWNPDGFQVDAKSLNGLDPSVFVRDENAGKRDAVDHGIVA